eukprot:396947_1
MLQSTLDKVIVQSKELNDDDESEPFWPIEKEEKKEHDEYPSTTAHPFPNTKTSINDDMSSHKRLLEIQMMPKRIIRLQKQLKRTKNELKKEQNTSMQVASYWKNRSQEISATAQDLKARMENLERMVDKLSSDNDNLGKENESLKAEIHHSQQEASAHEIFLQLK